MALALAGCAGADGGKAGAPQPVTLTFGNPYATVAQYEPAVQAFVDDVQRRSGGLMKISGRNLIGGKGSDLEQQTVRAVASGKVDLAWTGTRVYDTLGVDEFRALTAPLLIDSVPLERAVLAGDLPARMLPGLDRAGVRGLAILAGGLRRPIAVRAPLLAVPDWRGITFQTFRSRTAAATVQALGGTPSDTVMDELAADLGEGRVTGFEKDLRIYLANAMYGQAPYVTANVVLWPETAALVASPQTWNRLTERQRGWLLEAAHEASAASSGLVDDDQGLLAALCARGARFPSASPGDLRAINDAVAGVYRTLDQDPFTRDAVAEIRRLKAGLPAAPPLAVPAGCTGTAPTPAATATAGLQELVGTWRTDPIPIERLRAAGRKAGGSEQEVEDFVGQLEARTSEQFEVEFGTTTLTHYEISDDGPREQGWVGTYTVEGSTIYAVDGQGPCHIDYLWTLREGLLTLKVLRDVGDSQLCGPRDLLAQRVIYETAPFHKVS